MKFPILIAIAVVLFDVYLAQPATLDKLFPFNGGSQGRQCGSDGNLESLIMFQLAKQMSQRHSPCAHYNGCADKLMFRDCADLYKAGFHRSGVYSVYPVEAKVLVYCDMDTDDGGWTVFQRRRDGSVNFNRTWQEYANGFGDLRGEFWMGNDLLSLMTGPETYELRVDMEAFNGTTASAKYEYFSVGPKAIKYVLTVGGYSGSHGDSLGVHTGLKFSTWDQDNDIAASSCAKSYGGGGNWFSNCYSAFLNGPYSDNNPRIKYAAGIVWQLFTGYYESLKAVTMKFRPAEL